MRNFHCRQVRERERERESVKKSSQVGGPCIHQWPTDTLIDQVQTTAQACPPHLTSLPPSCSRIEKLEFKKKV
jgi:hypothetical protein